MVTPGTTLAVKSKSTASHNFFDLSSLFSLLLSLSLSLSLSLLIARESNFQRPLSCTTMCNVLALRHGLKPVADSARGPEADASSFIADQCCGRRPSFQSTAEQHDAKP